MNITDLHILLHKPEQTKAEDATHLENLLQEFPYFQSARALYLKSLYLQKSYKYNSELKKTATYTTDRDILFEFITSPEFISYKPFTLIENNKEINAAVTKTINPLEQKEIKKENKLIDTLLNSIIKTKSIKEKQAEPKIEKEDLEEKLEIGKPLHFNENEKYSFQQWLQLSKFGSIQQQNTENTEEKNKIIDPKRKKKLELIDKFIETNPKITPTKNTPSSPVNIEIQSQDNSNFMTETLAKIYLEQKKYQKAIQAYEILILKYPEKSSYFADHILDIKALQQHNS